MLLLLTATVIIIKIMLLILFGFSLDRFCWGGSGVAVFCVGGLLLFLLEGFVGFWAYVIGV